MGHSDVQCREGEQGAFVLTIPVDEWDPGDFALKNELLRISSQEDAVRSWNPGKNEGLHASYFNRW